ncbi:uncharacterized protein LOC122377821 isoform X2 [Amphibalanus amphitrite]|uniref:uncharacterized protein LOC122377821 isoform X2 n=1 Tax=Amphibalanus amphitrite TaxID=1232801 RepID=UPI001C91C22E|nr:uncharacterized protein LOC122377821 isoform X2 [Amphibalanus amphitrite]
MASPRRASKEALAMVTIDRKSSKNGSVDRRVSRGSTMERIKIGPVSRKGSKTGTIDRSAPKGATAMSTLDRKAPKGAMAMSPADRRASKEAEALSTIDRKIFKEAMQMNAADRRASKEAEAQQSARGAEPSGNPRPDDEPDLDTCLEEDLGFNVITTGNSPWKEKATEHGSSCLAWVRKWTRGRYEDWLFLSLLGSLMGIYSFGIDVTVQALHNFRLQAFMAAGDLASRMVVWYTLTSGIAIAAALFIAWFIPSATGSGFPEMKAYLQGVKMKNTFSPITCIGKIIFLPITLCTELPLGKEGPVTHVAAIFALFITKIFKDISAEELERHSGNELVAAACTMGAAVCYGAPVGGVLFSIEATRSYFAVRNYWRGFFAAVCGTLFYKYLSQMYHGTDILPMYQESYTQPLPFNFEFLAISVAIGLLCGVVGPTFVWIHRQLLKGLKKLEGLSTECLCRTPSASSADDPKSAGQGGCCLGLKTHRVTMFRFLYTVLVCVVVSGLMLPWGDGYSPVMSHISTRQQLTDLMANISWEDRYEKRDEGVFCPPGIGFENCTALLDFNMTTTTTPRPPEALSPRLIGIIGRWTGSASFSYQTVLVMYIAYYFFGTLVCTTLTLPSGALIPIFKVGVAIGRLLGEFYCSYRLVVCLPNLAIPSAFACMCGAALCASVTHAISISVIVFELTGQITYVLPILTSVLVSNALSRHLQPSMYDSLIKVKKITVLPKMRLSNIPGGYANVTAQDIMTTDFPVLSNYMTLNSLRKLVHDSVKTPSKVLPLVDSKASMEPLGLVHVRRVRRFLREELGQAAWQRERPKFYLTMNAFKTLDWQTVRDTPAVDNLDLEVPPEPESEDEGAAGESDEATSSNPNGQKDGVRVDAYCTVQDNDQLKVRWNLIRRSTMRAKRPVCLRKQPVKSALKNSPSSSHLMGNNSTPTKVSCNPDSDSAPAATSTPTASATPTPTPDSAAAPSPKPSQERRLSRFSIKRVDEDMRQAAMAVQQRHKEKLAKITVEADRKGWTVGEEEDSGQGSSIEPINTAAAADSMDSLDDGLTDSSSGRDSPGDSPRPKPAAVLSGDSPSGGARPRPRPRPRRPGIPLSRSGPNLGAVTDEVYDSMTEQSSRASRLKDGMARMLAKAASVDLEERSQNTKKRLLKQFSMSDLNNKDGDDNGTLNMGQLMMKTLDRTANIFTAFKIPTKDRIEEERRLQRAWRRQQLNRVVCLDEVIEVEPFPLSVSVETPIVQVHRMFAMLCANKMYVMDRRQLVGCLPLQRFSEFISGGHIHASRAPAAASDRDPTDPTPVSGYDTVGSESFSRRAESDFGSQDTLDSIGGDEEPPSAHPSGARPRCRRRDSSGV